MPSMIRTCRLLLSLVAMTSALSGCGLYRPPETPYQQMQRQAYNWYHQHPDQREAELMRCQHLYDVQGDPRCMAAIESRQSDDRLRDNMMMMSGSGMFPFGVPTSLMPR